MYLRDQYFVNQSNYPDTAIAAATMTTTFGLDFWPVVNGYGRDRNTNDTDTIVLIHSADYSNDCSKHNDDRPNKSFGYISNDGRTSGYEDVLVASELENELINDDDDGDDDANDAEKMSGDDDDDDFSREDSVSTNHNTNSITNPTDTTLLGMLLVVIADDDDDNPDYYGF